MRRVRPVVFGGTLSPFTLYTASVLRTIKGPRGYPVAIVCLPSPLFQWCDIIIPGITPTLLLGNLFYLLGLLMQRVPFRYYCCIAGADWQRTFLKWSAVLRYLLFRVSASFVFAMLYFVLWSITIHNDPMIFEFLQCLLPSGDALLCAAFCFGWSSESSRTGRQAHAFAGTMFGVVTTYLLLY